jgi:hypothetical protein
VGERCEAAQRREVRDEVGVNELGQRFGSRQVAQAMLAESLQLGPSRQNAERYEWARQTRWPIGWT